MFCDKLSNSKDAQFNRCKLEYRYKYVDRYEPFLTRNKGAMHFGSFIHRVLELGVKETTIEGLQKIADADEKLKALEDFRLERTEL